MAARATTTATVASNAAEPRLSSIARRGLRIGDLTKRGAGRMILQRLRSGEPGEPGAQTTLTSAYEIARAIDPAQADELVDALFEVIPRHASN